MMLKTDVKDFGWLMLFIEFFFFVFSIMIDELEDLQVESV